MFIIANFLGAVGYLLGTIITMFTWIVIISAVLSWVNADSYNPIVTVINRLSAVIVNPIRRTGKFIVGPVDFSPFVALLILVFLQKFLVRSILDISLRLH